MARLFPSASMDDPTLEADFRELAGDDLLGHKRQTAVRVLEYLDAGDRRPLTEEEQEAWLVLLTDLRLAMGLRLRVTDYAFDSFPNPTDPPHWAPTASDYPALPLARAAGPAPPRRRACGWGRRAGGGSGTARTQTAPTGAGAPDIPCWPRTRSAGRAPTATTSGSPSPPSRRWRPPRSKPIRSRRGPPSGPGRR